MDMTVFEKTDLAGVIWNTESNIEKKKKSQNSEKSQTSESSLELNWATDHLRKPLNDWI